MVHQNLNLLVSCSYVPHRVDKHLRKNKTIETGYKEEYSLNFNICLKAI